MSEMDANGMWNVVTGIEGKTEEVIYEINVEEKGAITVELFNAHVFH